jgi:hypothetical protein
LGEKRSAYKILVGKPEWRRPLGRLGINGKTGSVKLGWKMWIGYIWLRIGTFSWLCKCGNETSGSIRGEEAE